jgi:tRNA (cmo5U34)-methyltransferase
MKVDPMPVKELFDAGAREYDAGRRRVIFCFDAFYGTLLDLVPLSPGDRFAFLDLGAGTGLVSALILARFPSARAHLLDISEKMMEQARRRFADRPEVRFYIRDYAREDLPGAYSLIVSAMSIHHLEDSGKRELMQKIFSALEPGGAFIHAELARGTTEATEQHYQRHWQAHLEACGFTPGELAAIRDRMACDRPAPIEQQLAWLREAGFADVDCFFKHYNFSVSMGTKPKRP